MKGIEVPHRAHRIAAIVVVNDLGADCDGQAHKADRDREKISTRLKADALFRVRDDLERGELAKGGLCQTFACELTERRARQPAVESRADDVGKH